MPANSTVHQANFLGGEWSPNAQGRIDKPEYKTAMAVCRNGFPLEEGAWERRSGTKALGKVWGGGYAKLVPFAFEQAAPYTMEISVAGIRFWAPLTTVGGNTFAADYRLVPLNFQANVVTVSTATPAVVQISGATGAGSSFGQYQFIFSSAVPATFAPLLRNTAFNFTPIDATHFSLQDSTTGVNVDGSTLGWGTGPTSGTVTVVETAAISSQWTLAQLPSIRKVQAEQIAILLQGSVQPFGIRAVTLPTATTPASFNAYSVGFVDGPYLDPPLDGATITLTYVGTVPSPHGRPGGVGTSGAGTRWTGVISSIADVNGGAGLKSTDVGRLIRLQYQPPVWASGTAYTVGQSVTFNGVFYTCIVSNTGNEPDITVGYWSVNPNAAQWSAGQITTVSSASGFGFTVYGTPFPTSGSPVVPLFQLGVYSNTTGWPTCGVYYQGRVWFAGAIPNRIDASSSNGLYVDTNGQPYINFSPTGPAGTVADSNGISYVFNCEDVNPIFWVVANSTGIVCGTQAGEWVIAAPTAGPITPTNISANRNTKYGCANVEPEHTDLTISFVHRYSQKMLEYFPDVFSGRYTAPNLSQYAKHLTTPGIAEIRYQRELLPVTWARCNNGALLGCTYKRTSLFSSQGPEFTAWHRHDLGSGRTVQSMAVGPSVDGTIDTLFMTTLDPVDNVYRVEVMQPLFNVDALITSGWFVDGGVVPSGGFITINSTTGNTLTLTGLSALNGRTCTVVVGGVDVGDFAVSGSQVVVPIDAQYTALFSTSYLASISGAAYGANAVAITNGASTYTVPAMVGFTYTSQGQLLRPDGVDQSRMPTGPALGKTRRAAQFAALLVNTQGISFGTSFGALHTANFRQLNQTPYAQTQLFSGVYRDSVSDPQSYEGQLCWQISRPYPATVAAVAPFFEFQEG